MSLPPPNLLLGSDNHFNSWYPGQEDAFRSIMSWLSSDVSYMGLSAPTGSGKSALEVLAARMGGRRTVILTATKGLQAQITHDFGDLGIVDMRGQNSFPCRLVLNARCDEGPCHEGMLCALKAKGCHYYDQLRRALEAQIVVTNYAYWLAQTQYTEDGLGEVGLLACDESHMAFSALENHLTVYLEHADLDRIGCAWPPGGFDTVEKWRQWASMASRKISDTAVALKQQLTDLRSTGEAVPRGLSTAYKRIAELEKRLRFVADLRGKWVWEPRDRNVTFTPVWPQEYAQRLYGSVPKVLFMSALLTDRMLDTLAVPKEERILLEVPSYFPSANTPVWHVYAARMDYRATPEKITQWRAVIDNIIDRRKDRKGIIFTVSYDRANILLRQSRHRDRMFSHNTGDVVEMVQRFRAAPPGAILVSPAVTSGYDFPNMDCRWIILAKLAYPDTRSLVVKARMEEDDEWTSYQAMETLIQSSGRGTRSAEDWTEVFLVDDNWRWFWPKYKHFAPKWFAQRVRGSRYEVPDPLLG